LFAAGAALCAVVSAQELQLVEQTTEPEYTVLFTFRPPADWPPGADLRVVFDRTPAGEGYALVLARDTCRFVRTDGPKPLPLGAAGSYDPRAPVVHGVLQRRQSRMVAFINSVRVTTAQDLLYHGGAVGWVASDGALKLDDLLVQPVAEVEFTDDFVRETDSEGGWDSLAGQWLMVGPKGVSPRPDLSANPFCVRTEASQDQSFALTAAGHWFWDSYRVTVAAKAESPGALGLAAYVQDTENFLLFRWTSTGEVVDGKPKGRKQLIRVMDGSWAVLAEAPGGFSVDRWYELGLSGSDGLLRAEIDGGPVLRARETGFGQGRLGLFAQNIRGASFDDVTAYSTRAVADDFDDAQTGWWVADSGDWTCKSNHLYASASKPGRAEATIGDADWASYEIAADVKPKSSRAVGLSACRVGEGRGYVLRWEAGGKLTLALMDGGTQTVLGEDHVPQSTTRFQRLALRIGHSRLAVSVDGRGILECPLTGLDHGAAGLLIDGPGEACFDNVTVDFDEQRPPLFNVTAQFTREDTMKNWVDLSRQWQKTPDGTAWYDMPLFGDFTLWLPPIDLAATEGRLTVLIASEPKAEGAVPLVVSTQRGSAAVACRAARGDRAIAAGQAEAAPGERLRVVREGRCVAVWVGPKLIAACRDDVFAGRHLGLTIEGLPLDLSEAAVSSPQLLDVTFAGAPTGWTPTLGVWEVTDRWPCAPGWSWFGGSRHQSPLLWSKDILEGDQVFEFWAGLLMDLPKEPGYSHPSDINGIICGDGVNLCSGYSFILAGDNNTKSKMLKGNTVLAENPNVKFIDPVSPNFAFHRHWFDIRIEKTGNHLTYSVDGTQVAEWTDPEPLPAGKVGLWSYQNNGILVARARMAAERIRR